MELEQAVQNNLLGVEDVVNDNMIYTMTAQCISHEAEVFALPRAEFLKFKTSVVFWAEMKKHVN